MAKLTDFMNPDDFKPEYHKPDEFENIPLLLDRFNFIRGGFGQYAVMDCTDPSTGEVVKISTGSSAIMAQLTALKASKSVEYPVEIKFKSTGRAWFME